MFHMTAQLTGRRLSTVLIGGILLVAAFGLKVILLPPAGQPVSSVKPAAAPPVDQRLILHAHTVRVAGVLHGGLHLAGSLYPTLPGPNTLHLTVEGQRPVSVQGGRIEVVATMPGMGMAPARAILMPCSAGYCGTLNLPMFGHYQARAVIATPSGRIAGSLGIELPLPVG